MPQQQFMHLKVTVPFKVALEQSDISSITLETYLGSFGILPLRADCVAALAPGILTYTDQANKESYVAVDAGVATKTGLTLVVAVRNAVLGDDLAKLRATVDQQYLAVNADENEARDVMNKLEGDFMRKLADSRHD